MPPLDYPILWASLGLVAIGLSMVYSATSVPGAHEGLWVRQLLWFGVALVAAWAAASVHHRAYDSLAYVLYGISLLLLAAVLVAGTSAMGAKRWLDLGPVRFQPSEIAKIATVFVLARRFDAPQLNLERFRGWFPPLLIVLAPFVLVARQPDLGTSLSFPVILVAMYYWGGMPLRSLALGLTPVANVGLFFLTGSLWWFFGLFGALVAVVRPRWSTLVAVLAINGLVAYAVPQVWDHLHDYQKRRLETFLNPDHDPQGAGYQIIQSRIAIGSGGLAGKGFLKGTQKGLAFLPMRHTDFIYSVVGEELGLLGSLTVVVLYAVIIVRGFRLALRASNGFASLMAVGVVSALFYHILVNILMTIGWMPVTGLPLPLLSYGGTALFANCVQLGLLQNVALRLREY